MTAEGPLGDRPLGPVFEARFTACEVPVHVLVVRGGAEHLEQARASATDLLGLWIGRDGDVARVVRRAGAWVGVRPETVALLALAELARGRTSGRYAAVGPGPGALHVDAATGRVRLSRGGHLDLDRVDRGLVADIVARDLVDAGARGVCVNVGGVVRTDGLPPRVGGWSVELADPARPTSAAGSRALLVTEGAVATAGDVSGLAATVWSWTAWSAAALAVACAGCPDVGTAVELLARDGARGQVTAPDGRSRSTPGWAGAVDTRVSAAGEPLASRA